MLNTASSIRFGTTPAQAVYMGNVKVWPSEPGVVGHIATEGTYSSAGGTSFSIPLPPEVQVGDLCILVVSRDSTTTMTVTSAGLSQLVDPTVAGSMNIQALSGTVSGTSVAYTLSASTNHSAAAHFFRGLSIGTLGTPAIRSGTNTGLTVPGVTGSGRTWAIVAERSQAATVEEQIHTITTTWGFAAGYYEGNPTVNAGAGITAHWVVQGSPGESRDQTVTFGDASPSAWGFCLKLEVV